MSTGAGDDNSSVVAQELVYKVTSNNDIVVQRRLVLHPSFFKTYHDIKPHRHKRWILTENCQLNPANADDIKISRKTVRPNKTWTLTATVRGRGKPVELYTIQIKWPSSWVSLGYTTFTLGCTRLEHAKWWHSNFSQCLETLRQSGRLTPGSKRLKQRNSLLQSAMERLQSGSLTNSLKRLSENQDANQPDEPKLGSTSYGAGTGTADSGTPRTETLIFSQTVQPPAQSSIFFDASSDLERESSAELLGPRNAFALSSSPDRTLPDSDDDDDDDDDEEETGAGNGSLQAATSGRWIPYKQVNGLSVYYQHATDDAIGCGEYIVATIIRSHPKKVLDVLIKGTHRTTILGPARKVEILESRKEVDDKQQITKELVRMTIEAPGWAGVFCAPREIVVDRVYKTDENHSYVVLFNSSDDAVLRSRHYCNSRRGGGSGGMSSSGVETRETQEEATGQNTRRSIWRHPVQFYASGAYTISCPKGDNLATSKECLITCNVKVDLKGACGAHSWLGAASDLFGWREAFLDRILMNVMLVRDELEQEKFFRNPAHLMKAGAQLASAASAAVPALATNSIMLPPAAHFRLNNRSMTMAKSMVPRMASSSDGAPSPSAAGRVAPALMDPFREESETERGQTEDGGYPAGEAVLQYDLIASMACLDHKYWSQIHMPGTDAPFSVRGPTYLKDRKKIPAGHPQFSLVAVDLIEVPHVVDHVARFLPSIRSTGIPFAIVINLIIPGNPLLGIVSTFATEQHPSRVLSNPPVGDPLEQKEWNPFDYVMYKYYNGDAAARNKMLKLIPHIAEGSWLIKSSVGTTPVILGKALKTSYYETAQYIEIDIDISANNVASYVTGAVRGTTKSLVIDMGFVLEGQELFELPESLLGTMRLHNLDISQAKKIDVTRELPLVPPTYLPCSPAVDLQADAATAAPKDASVRLAESGASTAGVDPADVLPTSFATQSAALTANVLQDSDKSSRLSVGGGNLSRKSFGAPLAATTSFGMRHRHARTGSNVDTATLLAGAASGPAPSSPFHNSGPDSAPGSSLSSRMQKQPRAAT